MFERILAMVFSVFCGSTFFDTEFCFLARKWRQKKFVDVYHKHFSKNLTLKIVAATRLYFLSRTQEETPLSPVGKSRVFESKEYCVCQSKRSQQC